jgi:hypothetical protein
MWFKTGEWIWGFLAASGILAGEISRDCMVMGLVLLFLAASGILAGKISRDCKIIKLVLRMWGLVVS